MEEAKTFKVRVPGSTSNLGAGFDTVSAALSLYLSLQVEMIEGESLVWPPDWPLAPEDNMIEIAYRTACRELGIRLQGLRISVENDVPLQRGLGSSAAAIIAGIRTAEEISGFKLSSEDVFQIAYPLEGHPDNLSASLLGGWVLSRVEKGLMKAEKLDTKLDCRFVVTVPEAVVSTSKARANLPECFSLKDAVFNLQRVALLVHAISAGKDHLLREATRDRLHQEYRASLVPGLPEVLDREGLPSHLEDALFSVTVSGSGSTVLGIANRRFGEIGNWMTSVFTEHGVKSQFFVLDLDPAGATVL